MYKKLKKVIVSDLAGRLEVHRDECFVPAIILVAIVVWKPSTVT